MAKGDGLSERVHAYAARVEVFTVDQAAQALKETGARIRGGLGVLASTGQLTKLGGGKYRLSTAEDKELAAAAKPRPTTKLDVREQLNRAFMRLNDLREELDTLRHVVGVAERHVEARPSLSMQAASWDRE